MLLPYYAALDEYDDIPDNVVAKFVVAGKLPNGKLAAIQVLDINGDADAEVIEATACPRTLIFAPDDISDDACNQLLSKAIANTKKQKFYGQSLVETSLRKAVRYISEHSEYVGPKSDYVIIEA